MHAGCPTVINASFYHRIFVPRFCLPLRIGAARVFVLGPPGGWAYASRATLPACHSPTPRPAISAPAATPICSASARMSWWRRAAGTSRPRATCSIEPPGDRPQACAKIDLLPQQSQRRAPSRGAQFLRVQRTVIVAIGSLGADRWPDDVPVPTFGPRMACIKCGIRRAAALAGAATAGKPDRCAMAVSFGLMERHRAASNTGGVTGSIPVARTTSTY
jgi:hypothetical protein